MWVESQGLINVKKDGKWGFIDKTGNVVIPCIYDNVFSFHENGIAFAEKDGKSGSIDTTGNTVLPFIYEGAAYCSKQYDMLSIKSNGKWGVIDAAGNTVIPCIYDSSINLEQEFNPIVKDGKRGIMDKNGNVLIHCIYDKLSYYGEGLFFAEKDGKCGFINKFGDTVIPFIYTYTPRYNGNFENGIALVAMGKKDICIDVNGNEVIPDIYNIDKTNIDKTLISVGKDGKYGVLDNKGNTVIPLVYDEIRFDRFEVSSSCIRARANGKWGIFDNTGKLILPFDYDYIESFQYTGILVTYNGSEIAFDQPPTTRNNRTLVPFRAICEAMGATVEWLADTKQVKATLGDTELIFTIDSPIMTVNGAEKTIDQPPIAENGRTLLPARAFAEEFGASVDWNNETKTVIITK